MVSKEESEDETMTAVSESAGAEVEGAGGAEWVDPAGAGPT